MEDEFLEKSEFFGLDQKDLMTALESNCNEVVKQYTYSKKLTKLEIDEKNAQINQALQEIGRVKEEKKVLQKQIKQNTDLILVNNQDVISGSETITETVYIVEDSVAGQKMWINSEGLIVKKTRLKGAVQMNMFINKEKEAI
jgi:hypothetical protein